MTKKLLIIAGALIVIGAVEWALYHAYPDPGVAICGSDGQLFFFFLCTSRNDNYGIECGLQWRQCCCAIASCGGAIAEHNHRRLAELQQNAHFGALLTAQPDQQKQCRQTKGFVHLRYQAIH